MTTPLNPVINIPVLENIQFVNKEGYLSDSARQILLQLFQSLQKNAGPEGLVMPTQTASKITTIQNNTNLDGSFTCQFGTMLYDSTDNSIRITINNGSGAPIFKTVTLT